MDENTVRSKAILLDAQEVQEVPDRADGGGIRHGVLWQNRHTRVGVLHLPPGARGPRSVHEWQHHDLWVHDGSCELLGRYLRAGGYAHVPPGITHELVAGPTGCTLLYLRSEEGDL
jgi:hypothetical protein